MRLLAAVVGAVAPLLLVVAGDPATNGTVELAAASAEAVPGPGLRGPWIGVMGAPSNPQCNDALTARTQRLGGLFGAPRAPSSCFNSYYADWIEAAGARVVGIPYDASDKLLDVLMGGLSGMLWTGGDLFLEPNTTFYQTGRRVLDRVIAENRAGRAFPLMAICQGHQLLASLVAGGPSILSRDAFRASGVSLPLMLTPEGTTSGLIDALGPSTVELLTTYPIATHLNHDAIRPADFVANDNLRSLFRIVATARDEAGEEFVTLMEGQTMPLFGLQWHPERPQFDWRPDIGAAHTPEAITAMTAIAEAFVNFARAAPRTMHTAEHQRIARLVNPSQMERAVIGDSLYGISSLLFDAPTPSDGIDPAAEHAWRLPIAHITAHREDAPWALPVSPTIAEPATVPAPAPAESESEDEDESSTAAPAFRQRSAGLGEAGAEVAFRSGRRMRLHIHGSTGAPSSSAEDRLVEAESRGWVHHLQRMLGLIA